MMAETKSNFERVKQDDDGQKSNLSRLETHGVERDWKTGRIQRSHACCWDAAVDW
jgi:hypothetical protein